MERLERESPMTIQIVPVVLLAFLMLIILVCMLVAGLVKDERRFIAMVVGCVVIFGVAALDYFLDRGLPTSWTELRSGTAYTALAVTDGYALVANSHDTNLVSGIVLNDVRITLQVGHTYSPMKDSNGQWQLIEVPTTNK